MTHDQDGGDASGTVGWLPFSSTSVQSSVTTPFWAMPTSRQDKLLASNRHHCCWRRIKGHVIHFLCGRLIFLVRAGQ